MRTNFYPSLSYISSVTQGVLTTVTFEDDHEFTVGEIVSFRVGKPFGMYQLNNRRAKVNAVTDDTITVDIDSSTWDAFSLANLDEPGTSPPVCVPSSSGALYDVNIPRTNIEDAFDNRVI